MSMVVQPVLILGPCYPLSAFLIRSRCFPTMGRITMRVASLFAAAATFIGQVTTFRGRWVARQGHPAGLDAIDILHKKFVMVLDVLNGFPRHIHSNFLPPVVAILMVSGQSIFKCLILLPSPRWTAACFFHHHPPNLAADQTCSSPKKRIEASKRGFPKLPKTSQVTHKCKTGTFTEFTQVALGCQISATTVTN